MFPFRNPLQPAKNNTNNTTLTHLTRFLYSLLASLVYTAAPARPYRSPKRATSIFPFVDKSRRPLCALVFVLAFGPLAFVDLSERGEVVFNWPVALSGLSTLFTWGTSCLCHIRFRKPWPALGHALEELPFRAMVGVWRSWLSFALLDLFLVAQFYIAISPISGTPSTAGEVASNFSSRTSPSPSSCCSTLSDTY